MSAAETERPLWCCALCDWRIPVLVVGDLELSEEAAEVLWRATAAMHGWLRHPREVAERYGFNPEDRVSNFAAVLGAELFNRVREWATTDLWVAE